MSMTTLTPTKAWVNLSRLLRLALKGEDIGILVDGKIVALRPVTVESIDYAQREYGITVPELNEIEKTIHGKIEKKRKSGQIHAFDGDIEALVGRGH
jgi:antitoxin (DNA-binding transcriptional repressor) of toxin-antitoxin stability system